MKRSQLPITAIHAWSKLNDVSFFDVTVYSEQNAKGFWIATEGALISKDTFDVPALLNIPRELIISAEFIEEHAKVDHHFKQLLDAVGGQSLRGDVLLFLLMQITIGSPDHSQAIGVSSPWTEYVKMMPSSVPLPTMWTEEEQVVLYGTSLEAAVTAKMSALLREFEELREKTAGTLWCQKCWWESGSFDLGDWILLDAWFRSRSLELPHAGESMVPCLDMANHSASANAYYEQSSDNSVLLLLRPNITLESGSEITISYGDSKTPAEMLFTYGFIDKESARNSIILPVEPFGDDSFGKAKVAAYAGRPIIEISLVDGVVEWESPFLYMLCLNEEDGLDFRVLQQNDGSCSQLRVFWQEVDVTEKTTSFKSLVSSHDLKEVFVLRVVVFLQDRIRQQLERLYGSDDEVQSLASVPNIGAALQLREAEAAILEQAYAAVDMQKDKLLEDEGVLRYLGSMDQTPPEHGTTDLTNEEEDFS